MQVTNISSLVALMRAASTTRSDAPVESINSASGMATVTAAPDTVVPNQEMQKKDATKQKQYEQDDERKRKKKKQQYGDDFHGVDISV